jgi:hypothetical protein
MPNMTTITLTGPGLPPASFATIFKTCIDAGWAFTLAPGNTAGARKRPAPRTGGRAVMAKSVAAVPRKRTTGARKQATTGSKFTDQVYALIPASGGIEQKKIKIKGAPPNVIGAALSRLKKAERAVFQNEYWYRSPEAQKAAAA